MTAYIFSALAVWFVGLFIDANLGMGDYTGFLGLRYLFPLIITGVFILVNIKRINNKDKD